MSGQYTEEELTLMKDYFGISDVPNMVLFEHIRAKKLEPRDVLVSAQCWEMDGRPGEDDE